MYNSSIKGQGRTMRFKSHTFIPDKVFFNDMSKNYMCECFKTCDVVYSGIAWQYGYKIFNDNAGNIPNEYSEYCKNINKLIEELGVPAFITGGKSHAKFFPNAKMFNIDLNNSDSNMPNCKLFVWNYDHYDTSIKTTTQLIERLSKEFNKVLDFSCGYGEHLLKFRDFVGCDIDKNCLTYLSLAAKTRRVQHDT